MQECLIICNRSRPKNETGGAAAATVNAWQIFKEEKKVSAIFIKDLNRMEKTFLILKCLLFRPKVIAHDIEACNFLFFRRPHLVFHSQGSTVQEILMSTKLSYLRRIYFDLHEIFALLVCRSITFPTSGSAKYLCSYKNLYQRLIKNKMTAPLFGLYAGDSKYVPSEIGYGHGKVLQLLTVSSLLESKAVQDIPELIKKHFDGVDVNWTVIGRGPLLSDLQNNIREHGLCDKVSIITEFLSDEELDEYFRKCDMFVANHKIAICDRAIGQAMYHNKAVLLSDLPASRELNVLGKVLYWSDFDRNSLNSIQRLGNRETWKELWSPTSFRKRYINIFKLV